MSSSRLSGVTLAYRFPCVGQGLSAWGLKEHGWPARCVALSKCGPLVAVSQQGKGTDPVPRPPMSSARTRPGPPRGWGWGGKRGVQEEVGGGTWGAWHAAGARGSGPRTGVGPGHADICLPNDRVKE